MGDRVLCRNPFMPSHGSHAAYPCGQCMPCRVNKRRLWMSRMMLESYMHEDNCFVTLTYSPEKLPPGGTLVPKDTQDWLKRLRFDLGEKKIRYYLVGEYGDESERPHYHAAIFGIGPDRADLINSTWGKGFTYVGDLTPHSAQYVAGYVTKKLTDKDDPRLKGRCPEFARMSRRPGIGATALGAIRDAVRTPSGLAAIESTGDVPFIIQVGDKSYPIGRYLRSRLRKMINLGTEQFDGEITYGAPVSVRLAQAEEMRALFDAWYATTSPFEKPSQTFKQYLVNLGLGGSISIEARVNSQSQRRKL